MCKNRRLNKMLNANIVEVGEMPKIYCYVCKREIKRAPFYQIKKGFLFKKIERLHKNCALGRKTYEKRSNKKVSLEGISNASIIS